jgi:hypothetical protein
MKDARLPLKFLAGVVLLLAALPGGATPPPEEQVELELPPGVSFTVNNMKAGPVVARDPFPLSFRHATLGPGRALRISILADKLEPPGARLSFKATNPRSGTCRSGMLAEGVEVPIFESYGGAVAGGCDLLWTLESAGKPVHAGSYRISLRWKLEAMTVDRLQPVGSAVAKTAPPGTHGTGLPVTPGERIDRGIPVKPEVRRPPLDRR